MSHHYQVEVEVEVPHSASVDTSQREAPCYCWVEIGVLAPHIVSIHTTGEGGYHSARLIVLAPSSAFSDTTRWECQGVSLQSCKVEI